MNWRAFRGLGLSGKRLAGPVAFREDSPRPHQSVLDYKSVRQSSSTETGVPPGAEIPEEFALLMTVSIFLLSNAFHASAHTTQKPYDMLSPHERLFPKPGPFFPWPQRGSSRPWRSLRFSSLEPVTRSDTLKHDPAKMGPPPKVDSAVRTRLVTLGHVVQYSICIPVAFARHAIHEIWQLGGQEKPMTETIRMGK